MQWVEWEDYAAGMYAPDVTEEMVDESARLLGKPAEFHAAAASVIAAWPVAARHNLDHMWTGRNAWLGQAACCFAHQATSAATRVAWGLISPDSQRRANAVATTVRAGREGGKHGIETLFAL